MIKQIYNFLIKPILNLITVRPVRKLVRFYIDAMKQKKLVALIEAEFKSNAVLIFQQQFLDRTGSYCFNGGAERYVQDLADVLVKTGYAPYLIQWSDKVLWQKQIGNINVIGLPARKIYAYQQSLRYFKKYKFVIYSGATDWGHKLLHPNVLISHGITWDTYKKEKTKEDILKIFDDVDHIVSVDTNTLSWLRSTFPVHFRNREMSYIPNYVDTKFYKPIKQHKQRLKILFPRRASPERGYWLISKVLPTIMQKYNNIDFQFVGFAHGESIQTDLKRLNKLFPDRISHRIVEANEMVKVYQSADISLIPTLYSEGTSLSCLEAQACGNVVIATNIGGLPNLIIDGFNGLLINPTDIDLLQALDTVLCNQNLREKLSSNAVQVAQSFDIDIWKKRWRQIIYRISNSANKGYMNNVTTKG